MLLLFTVYICTTGLPGILEMHNELFTVHNLAAKSVTEIVSNVYGLAAMLVVVFTITAIAHAARSDLEQDTRIGWGVAAVVGAVLAFLCKRRAVRRCKSPCVHLVHTCPNLAATAIVQHVHA